MKKIFRKNLILLVILVFFIIKLISLFVHHDVWWDSSVYVGMGKYVYSFGKAGLWEASRPLVWPIMLGFFWKIGLDYVFFGKLMVVLFSLGCSILVYVITLNIFNRKVALYATLFFCFSPTFFLFNNILHSEIISTFFLLLGIYFFIKKKHSLCGLFLGISFMTRLFDIFFVFLILVIYLFLAYKKRESIKNLIIFFMTFLVPVVPYLLLNSYLYNNPFYPFILQSFMTKYTGWVFHQPISFYFVNLIKENILVLFAIIGCWIVFKRGNFNKRALLTIFLFIFILYNTAKHKEMRLLISVFPFLYAFVGYGFVNFVDLFKKNKKWILFLLLIIWSFQTIPQLEFNRYNDNLGPFYSYVDSMEINNGIWITNPSFIVFSDKKAEELVYYPLYNSVRSKELQTKIDTAQSVLINTCDILPCPPADDCLEETEEMIGLLNEKLRLVYYGGHGECRHYIFEK